MTIDYLISMLQAIKDKEGTGIIPVKLKVYSKDINEPAKELKLEDSLFYLENRHFLHQCKDKIDYDIGLSDSTFWLIGEEYDKYIPNFIKKDIKED